MSVSPSPSPRHRWWIALAVLAGAAAVATAWWAGQRAEQESLAEHDADVPALRAASPTRPARSTKETAGGLASATARQPQSDAPISTPAPTAELSPLPWPFWEYRLKQALPPRSPPLVPPPWRMIGATQTTGGWSLVVLRQGRTAPEFFKVGESLPGGYRVAAISQDDVTLESGGRSVVLSFIGTR